MIHPLRRRHRALIVLVFIVVVVAAALALTHRAPDPVMNALPSTLL